MREGPDRTGVCIVRIETQGAGVLITLRTNPDIEQLSGESVRSVSDINLAIEAIRTFLVEFSIV